MLTGTNHDHPEFEVTFDAGKDLYCRESAKACLAAANSLGEDGDDICELPEWDTLCGSMHYLVEQYFNEECDDLLEAVRNMTNS